MTPALSTYLDLLRFSAALWVALAHLGNWGVVDASLARWLPASGRDAVVVFFVLSGFVIAYTAARKAYDCRTYLIERFARIYSVALPVLLGSVAIDLVMIRFNPQNYPLYQYHKLWIYIPIQLTFLAESWFLSVDAFTIPQYWSLCYEFWYYVLFAALTFYRGSRRILFAAMILMLVGFKSWLLLPLWYGGVFLYRQSGVMIALTPVAARFVWILTFVVYAVLEASDLDVALWQSVRDAMGWAYEAAPLGQARKFASDYVVGILVAANIHSFRYCGWHFGGSLTRVIRWASGCTFTLYLVHGVVYGLFLRNISYDRGSVLIATGIFLGALLATFLVGAFTERRIGFFRAVFSRIFRRLEGIAGRVFPGGLAVLRP